ncbi:hypothetical protein GFS24_13500 [Chitinophaga sp. SYP-B3965]|uniref:hypothetical protein n=1 Tax=Chitinophaga sp. SYP-B3965 TaxID=2663120 RepID=UPI001299B3C8|nr:hypothetical protein [Chitinophaga sp. SYP-B3965]MRG46138.1 hypothetical protein [Chitinophaga sp. SYP-B3965]
MKTHLIVVSLLAMVIFAACKKDVKLEDQHVKAGVLLSGATLPGIIDTEVVLYNGTYYLNGKTFIKPGGNLVIHAGVIIKGISKPTPAQASALVVTRGGLIHALGTVDQPVIFTSDNTIPAPGDWGGIVILGSAPVNQAEPLIEGIDMPTLPPAVDMHYGGSYATDSSGVLRYVRIEWAGAILTNDNELNSLTLGGVGSRTVLDYIQASYGLDDSFQFFGGTVNATHLVSLNTKDDILDFNLGYTGTVQYVLGIRRPGFVYSSANGIESDNGGGPFNIPITRPAVSNVTMTGGETSALPGTQRAVYIKTNSGINITNSIFTGYGTGFQSTTPNVFTGNVVHAFSTLGIPAGNIGVVNSNNSNGGVELVDPFSVGVSFDPSTTLAAHTDKGCNPAFDYWFLTWTAGL